MLTLLDFTTLIAPTLLCLTLIYYFFAKNASRKVFMLDFSCYKPPSGQAISKQMVVEVARHNEIREAETLEFMKRTVERSGLGNSTYLPESLLNNPPNPCLEEARREAEMVIFGAVDELLGKTKVNCLDIGIVVVNCCVFIVTPSLSSIVVNRYKLRDGVVSYSLSGMGCAASLWAICLAKQLLQVHPNCYALVVSTEILTENGYKGNDRSKVIGNCIFRVGGAAILLSNRPSDRHSSKYQLIHAVNTHTASSEGSYNSIISEEDEQGHMGVTITKGLIAAAIHAIESNITSVAPLILPVSERVFCVLNYLIRSLHVAKIEPYTANFKNCFDHFLPHVGAKPIQDQLQRSLNLTDGDMEASRMTLYRFGNTSSSTVWYELAYAEAKGRVKRGDRVWHMAFGSGFKCCSIVWLAIKTIDREAMNPWSDEIDGFPVDLSNIAPLNYFHALSK